MSEYIYTIKQGSDEWVAVRVGKFSASYAADLLMDKKTSGYKNLIDKIVEERITGQPTESKTFSGNYFTERGISLEPVAVDDYEMRSFNDTQIIGVVIKDEFTLCSPDRLINDNGLLQIKCPIFSTQREYLRTQKVPGNYLKQMNFELFVTGREYNIFYSYHPYLPAVEIKVYRDEVMIAEIQRRLNEAKNEVIAEMEFLKSLK